MIDWRRTQVKLSYSGPFNPHSFPLRPRPPEGMATLNNIGKALAGFCFVCTCPALLTQSAEVVLHGSIVLVVRENNRILFAGDSMGIDSGREATYSSCKITPLGDTIFSAVGNIDVGNEKAGKRVFLYEAHELAKATFARFKDMPNTDSRTRRTADYWGASHTRTDTSSDNASARSFPDS
jgi:hypothetical protein